MIPNRSPIDVQTVQQTMRTPKRHSRTKQGSSGSRTLAKLHSRILSVSGAAKEAAELAGVQSLQSSNPVVASLGKHRSMILRSGIIKMSHRLMLAFEIIAQRLIAEVSDRSLVVLNSTRKKRITTNILRGAGYNIYGYDLHAMGSGKTGSIMLKKKPFNKKSKPDEEEQEAPPAVEAGGDSLDDYEV